MSESIPPNPPNNLSLLEHQLNLKHPLIELAQSLDWNYFEIEFGKHSLAEVGRPRLATRLVVGVHYLKALYDESDESVVNKWVENPYWQYFCGESIFRHDLPCHPTTLVKWRQRVGAEGVEKLREASVTNGSGSASPQAQ